MTSRRSFISRFLSALAVAPVLARMQPEKPVETSQNVTIADVEAFPIGDWVRTQQCYDGVVITTTTTATGTTWTRHTPHRKVAWEAIAHRTA